MEIKCLKAILNKPKDKIINTNIRLGKGVDEIKMTFKRVDEDGMDTWCG